MNFYKSFTLNILLLYKKWCCDDNDLYVDELSSLEQFIEEIETRINEAIKIK